MSTPLEVQLAIGRIFRIASRPEQPGDIAEYQRCRSIILDASEPQTAEFGFAVVQPNTIHDYARDRLKGAQGDGA